MESTEDPGRHKPSIEPLDFNPSTLLSSDDTEVVFSEDYIDSPQSSDMRSPLDVSSGDCSASDDMSSLGTVDDDVNHSTRTQHDLSLPSVPSSSGKESGNLNSDNNDDRNLNSYHNHHHCYTVLLLYRTTGGKRVQKILKFAIVFLLLSFCTFF